MKKLMAEAYGTKASPEVKEQIIRDFFYETMVRDTSRRQQEKAEAEKEARIRQRARIRKKSHYHRDLHHRGLESDPEIVEATSEEG